MGFEHVKGENRGKILLYALSTCVWCNKTKKLLADLGVEYSYIYIDLLEGDQRDRTIEEVRRHNPNITFPTTVIDDDRCIIGFKEKEIKEALGL
ncbi:MAG TPA: glutaredoxin family protein [Methanothrix sp.]|mgnify:FL=1|nr:glutaredoxin family protein [Methanothrix sp.]HRW83171.1 glutaredoxin family protein [Methanothrix sp.]